MELRCSAGPLQNVTCFVMFFVEILDVQFFFSIKPDKVKVKTNSGCLFGIGSLHEMVDKAMKDHICPHIISVFGFPSFFAFNKN